MIEKDDIKRDNVITLIPCIRPSIRKGDEDSNDMNLISTAVTSAVLEIAPDADHDLGSNFILK